MISPINNSMLLLITSVTLVACDQPDEETTLSYRSARDSASTPEVEDAAAMTYEDAEDFAILHDTSNLRPPDLDTTEYRRRRQQLARDELREALPVMNPPTQADIELLSVRWFTQGVGVVAQNHSARSFSIAAYFSSSTDASCNVTVPWKLIGPKASAMFTADDMDCSADRADITINDEYGFFADSLVVTPSEGRQ